MFRRCCFSAAVFCGALAVRGSSVPIYPSNDGFALNLRVPTYAKPDVGAKGDANPFGSGAAFTYRLSDHLKFEPGNWRIDFCLRSIRQSHDRAILTVGGNAGSVVFGNGSNRVGKNLPYLQVEVPKAKASGAFGLPHAWTPASVVSEKGEIVVTVGGRELCRMKANPGFVPSSLKVGVWYVDELKMTGRNGTFALDWENRTYAGRCDIVSDGGVSANVMGFDTMVVSTDRTKRDCPVLSVANTTAEPRTFDVAFAYHTEIAGEKAEWTQRVVVGAGSEKLAFVEFPKGLHDDIYHLTIRCPGLNLDQTRHFMYVQRRGEKKGDDKFGWHEVCNYHFGGYMDAIPVAYPVRYMYPHGVYDDEWVEDFRAASKLGDPKTPKEAWNWPNVAEWLRVEGRKFGLCVHNYPGYDYTRDRKIPELCDQEWHKGFLRECAARYRDNVVWWEVENEPNCGHKFFGQHPEHYVIACRSMKEVMSRETPGVPVYGISTQGNWIEWMDDALAAGAGRYLDGVSFHTYAGDCVVENTNMKDIVLETRKRFPGKPMVNTETGVSVASREKIDDLLAPDYIADAKARCAPGFYHSNGWCNPIDELTSAVGITRNALINFQCGVRVFTFFFPTYSQWTGGLKCINWKKHPHEFTAHACTPDGTMSPNRLLLAGGVLACQLEPAIIDGVRPVEGVLGVNGVVFPKTNGGTVAAIWAVRGTVDVTVRADVPEIECVGMQGERSVLRPLGKDGDVWSYQIPLDRFTRYLHTTGKVFDVVPVPLTSVYAVATSAEAGEIVATFENAQAVSRSVTFAPVPDKAVLLEGGTVSFALEPAARREVRMRYRLAQIGEDVTVRFRGKVDGSIPLSAQTVIRALKGVSLVCGRPVALAMNRDDQVVLGHADDLTSLTEASKFWAGAEDLSGRISLDWDDRAFVVSAEMTDRQFKLAHFPGIDGTSVELFCDFRAPGKGLGDARYTDGCYQFLIEPTTAATSSVLRVFSPQFARQKRRPPLPGATGMRTKAGYRLTVRIPWRLADESGTPPETFGFDFGANCAYPDKEGRRAQMMLFGTRSNAVNASKFGRIRLVGERNNAVVPVPMLEKDGYDWHARHLAAIRPDGVRASKPEFVFLGDSILHRWAGGGTESFGVGPDVPANWKKWFGAYRTLNLGFGWDRTQNLLWRIENGEVDGIAPKWMVILIGTNNMAPWGYARQNTGDEIGAGVEAIVRAVSRKLPQTKILLLGILPRGNPADWFVWADAANASIEKRCAKLPGVTYVRLRDEFIGADGFLKNELYTDDRVHLTDKGYDVLGQAISNWVRTR